jgi:hypothetical protein
MSLTEKIEAAWLDRAKASGLKPASRKYDIAEVEFFVGAMACMDAQGQILPPKWVIAIMSGRPVA